ncbi:MAG: hypothetical protein QOF89_2634 [Acidobacteriota bacterium]|nr:hypothetical protein [Acidobacteriota bacterium]
MDAVLGNQKISRTYNKNHVRIGGVKLVLDGSPQGRSAWFKESYKIPPVGQDDKYKGVANYPDETSEKWLAKLMIQAYQKQWQVMLHANGDAAIQQLIDISRNEAVQKAAANDSDRRTVLIHGQFLQRDQIEPIKDLKIFPSLFPMHTFYWGDWYVDILGPDRAKFISPTKAVQDKGMKFSIHSDAPVTKPNSMRLLDSAVNRTTRNGYVLGEDQRISPIVALKALTIWPAYQHFEEKTKGSIEVGKKADFVVLGEDPLSHVPRNTLIHTQIVQTFKNGKVVYDMEEQKKPEWVPGKKYQDCVDNLEKH